MAYVRLDRTRTRTAFGLIMTPTDNQAEYLYYLLRKDRGRIRTHANITTELGSSPLIPELR